MADETGSMTEKGRLPVVVGVAQVTQRVEPADAVEPIALMEQAARAAGADSGSDRLLARLDRIIVVRGAWSYPDPGRILADRLGAGDATTYVTANGGNAPQAAVAQTAAAIQAGELDASLICGGEVIYSRQKLRAVGKKLPTTVQEGVEPAPVLGDDLVMRSDLETERGFDRPPVVYPLLDSAIGHHRGETLDEHRDRVSRLWEGFNRVAVASEHSWVRTPMTAAEIREPGPGNRMVGFPYTKAMNSNWFVDQAAAVVVCAAEVAEAAGVPRDRWVFLRSAAEGHAPERFSERYDLWSSPAIRETGSTALELARLGIDDIGPIDLYSCFPSVVQLTMAELGIAEDRQVTQTGGLTFAGGPLNNYVSHGIAATVEAVRETGEPGLVHANGGYATKQAFGVYSVDPPDRFRHRNVQPLIDSYPTRSVDAGYVGEATIEAFTVMHDHEGPEHAQVTLLTDGGDRVLASSTDEAVMSGLLEEDQIGRRARVPVAGTVALA